MSVAAQPAIARQISVKRRRVEGLHLAPVARFSCMRALLWSKTTLYVSRGYELLRATPAPGPFRWEFVARFRPAWWRNLTASQRLTSRLCRDGFHALARLSSGDLVAAAPGAILHHAPGETEFTITHRIRRGTRPLHITATPDGRVYWGEYFDNPNRDEVHIYVSTDRGRSWDVAYTFPRHSIRHVHNIVHDEYGSGLWILTGDDTDECKILHASADFKDVEVALCGDQQARAVALVPMTDAVYFASDTPLERNHIYSLDRSGSVTKAADIASSCIQGCRVGKSVFFSTMAEPSQINLANSVHLYGSSEGAEWRRLQQWPKDRWPMRFFQYGNAFLPTGPNETDLLAISTVAVEPGDLQPTLWQVIA
jgi:hypothetical protein